VKSVPSEIVQLVNINAVFLVADEIELPISHSIFLSADQSSDPFDFVRFEMLAQTFFSDEGHEQLIAGQFVCPFDWLFFARFGNLGDNQGVKSVAIGPMTQIMQ